MVRKLILLGAIVAALGLAGFWLLTTPSAIPGRTLGAHTPDAANGKELFYVGGCASCHATPGQEDHTRLGGGLALKSPFGTFYAPNISPERDGIGGWNEAEFVTAMTRGTSPEGEHYYPSFPYTAYQQMSVDDVRDLFAFLKTLPPVQGRVRAHDLPFPFNIRRGVGLWKLLYLSDAPFAPDATKSPQWNRGAYLANGPGHCAECHSPRNALGAIVAGQRFAGGPDPEGRGWSPNITEKGLADWSDKDIAYLLETGQTPKGDSVGGSMTAVVRNTAQLTADDRAAIAVFIKSLPPVEGPVPPEKP
jgi:mono/diheme cytochrome c family protein